MLLRCKPQEFEQFRASQTCEPKDWSAIFLKLAGSGAIMAARRQISGCARRPCSPFSFPTEINAVTDDVYQRVVTNHCIFASLPNSDSELSVLSQLLEVLVELLQKQRAKTFGF